MIDRREQFLQGQEKVFARAESLRTAARRVLERLRRDPETQTVTLPPGDPLLCRELFLNCVKMRGEKMVLDCCALRTCLGNAWNEWLSALQQSGGFTVLEPDRSRDELFHRLCFQIPSIDWREFRSELRAGLEIDVLNDAFRAAEYLTECPPAVAPAELGARLFQDSKRLKNHSVLTWLCRFLRQKNGIDPECADTEILEKFGLTANPTASTVMVFGPFCYESAGERMTWVEDLWHRNQSAILSCDNLNGLGKISISRPVLTIENETVFNRMKQGQTDYALVYTAGFPGRAVRRWIEALPPETLLFHWGDGDPEGFEIAAILHALHPLELFRCDAGSMEQRKDSAIPLSPAKQKRAERLARTPDFPFQKEIDWILQNRCWLEQESFLWTE